MPKYNPKSKSKRRQRQAEKEKEGKRAPRMLTDLRYLTRTYSELKREEVELAKKGEKLSAEKQKALDDIENAFPEAAELAMGVYGKEMKDRNKRWGRFGLFKKKKKKGWKRME
jgi:hypothetical protein